ncbi:glycoside hydrolase family 76 protein [Emydomyces testavorans]|uniref:Mannan endo-1,6-alpha-mannosidase n=1 Tax=Emydomyces testavorans TaxID=2070801 RepID=A0AAF0DI53_9EURO|nr:glycoside hydrolase family 76 protein [Emydomyces testavorans]
MTAYYTGHRPGDVPGNLPLPYYWWEAGAMFGALIDYWFYTGDDTWNEATMQALLHQASPTHNFMPPNQTKTEGNDDQGFWGMAAMTAAERNFPNPPASKPQWLSLAQGVFNSQAARWDTETCAGGLKWQIFRFNRGYNYKNTISNGCFFNIASRLALYTKNDTYAEWAIKTWDWTKRIGLVTPDYQFFDGSDDKLNCSELNREQWTYNAGVYLHGAASMYNYTNGDEVWRERVQGIVDGLHTFFYNKTDIMFEVTCEPKGNCLVDQRSFKAYLARWMAATVQLAPFTRDLIMPKLRASAMAAAKACTGGDNGATCGLKWTTGQFDGSIGVGEQMAAMEIFQSNLIGSVNPPVSADSGGTSKGDPSAGVGGKGESEEELRHITLADRAGAGVVTALLMMGIVGGSYFAISE